MEDKVRRYVEYIYINIFRSPGGHSEHAHPKITKTKKSNSSSTSILRQRGLNSNISNIGTNHINSLTSISVDYMQSYTSYIRLVRRHKPARRTTLSSYHTVVLALVFSTSRRKIVYAFLVFRSVAYRSVADSYDIHVTA